MADALVSKALEKLDDVLERRLAFFADASSEFERLKGTLQIIRAVLADAESRQVEEKGVQLWLSGVRQVAYDIDNLLEEGLEKDGSSDDDEAGDGYAGNRLRTLTAPYTCLVRTFSRYKVADDVKKIRKRLDQIVKDKTQFILGGERRPRPMTTSLMKNEEIIGRDDDSDAVISRLVSGSSSGDDGQRLQVIAIVGIGGVGKTALARKIYHDGKVRDHFECLYWVCVSDDFDLKRLTKEIIEQVEEASTSISELDLLQNELLEALRGKRFLLVLDDVWNDNREKWKRLRCSLSSGAPGSRILVTTRLQKVAENTISADYIHHLKGLSDDVSWTLFGRIAFDGRTAEECLQLESVGREIVLRCKGVPLSIIVMGRAMHSKKTVSDWQNILDRKTWSLPETENNILPALWLSYNNLPPHLKQCFAYCSIYKKDQVMYKDEVVKLWIAQGFVQSQGERERDDIGAEYFDDLVAWSMFQEVFQSDRGKVTFRMHELLHDLAVHIAKDEIYTLSSSNNGKSEQRPSSDVRHALFYFPDSDDKLNNIPIAFPRARKLKTLWFDGAVDGTDSVILDLFYRARFLKALILSGTKIVKLPKAIGRMKQLRYLSLFRSKIEELPESVCHLHNLHTLNVTGCAKRKRLPGGMGRMVGLRHLEIEDTDSLESLPKGLGRITFLRSLSKFIVRGGGGRGRGGCGIDELQQLNSLRGILRIQHLERVPSKEEAEKAQLWNKQHLRSLVLSMLGRDDADTKTMDGVLEGLRPHENLEELKLFWYTGSNLPGWIQSLRCLRKLELYGCPNLEGLLHHLESASLSQLMIRDCNKIEGIARSSSVFLEKIAVIDSSEFFSSGLPHLPKLKTFEIRRFRNETLPDGGWQRLVALQKLEIWNCDELKSLPDGLTQLQSLENLVIFGCDKLESLPEGLGQLKKLNGLTIGVLEALTCLPDSLGQLESLAHLEISSCDKLDSLPEGLGQLKKLKSLTIHGLEALKCLHDSLGQLESLEDLEISSCKKLKSLPASLGKLKKVKSLTIQRLDLLSYLPDSLGQLQLLEELDISYCKKLESLLEEGLGQFKKLKLLRIRGLQGLTCLPDSLEQLQSLEHLEISSCEKLESLPHGLGVLKTLKSLTVQRLEVLTYLPDSLGELQSLEELDIACCEKLVSLPDGLGQLKKLKLLRIQGLQALIRLPDSLGHLEALQLLFVRDLEKLESLPHSLGQLKAINRLEISNCKALESLPHHEVSVSS